MTTLLFDIDGTLISAGGAGLAAIGEVFNSMFGISSLPPVIAHGRTDQGILTDIFSHHELDYEAHREPFNSAYYQRLPKSMEQKGGRVLPGVNSLIPLLADREDLHLGLLTGNARSAAEIKLRHFELESFFHFGGFGDVHADRNDVAKEAWEASRAFAKDRFDPSRVWVIGDTPNDVRCARAVGANVLAVATGGFSKEELVESNPDTVLDSLADHEAFMQVIGLAD